MRRGLRRTRSASVPSTGPTRVGAHMASRHSAASPFEPVRSLTHTPEASHSADVPKPEITTPVRYSRALRSCRTRTGVHVDVVMPGHGGSKAPPRHEAGAL